MDSYEGEVGGVSRAWYSALLEQFLSESSDAIIGRLVQLGGHSVLSTQVSAWREQIVLLKAALQGLPGSIVFEFAIPRMGRRIDVVLLIGPVVFVVEFKIGSAVFDRTAIEQVWDYALDLKNFHLASHQAPIAPILVASEATYSHPSNFKVDADGVYRPITAQTSRFREIIGSVLSRSDGAEIDTQTWLSSPYRPTPTIIEAARALYAHHSVEAIARHDAGAENLRVTSRRVESIVEDAKRRTRKVICFVTGVPGAGKTLVGLNVATRRQEADASAHAVYLSGNGPLVAVLREALTRDEVERQKSQKQRVRKGAVGESVKAFIQNVHHFRDDAIAHSGAPSEHVAIFDEAQRAWTLRKTASFMKRKKGIADFSKSEPEFLVGTMDRHDWAVVVCLVGGGQEINDGEAGIDAWLEAVNSRFPKWDMYISSRLTDSEYAAGRVSDVVQRRPNTRFDDCLHLSVSMRSFRAENVSQFVKALLDLDLESARGAYARLADRYPLVLTRNLDAAKSWVRDRARGSERFGLLASSNAQRLKPHAIDIRVEVNPVHWFLNGRDDTRSSFYLEDAATEFQVQGLELDWTCVTWDADLRLAGSSWSYHDFRGSRWTKVNNDDNRRYLLNAYRVLLTRARQGMVLFIPPGDHRDPTRAPDYYDGVAKYLGELGIPSIN